MAEVALSVQDLSVSYPVPGSRRRIEAVIDASFEVESGSVLALVGESGSGKSSTARALLGLAPRDSGEIDIAGVRWNPGEPFPPVARTNIQMVFQDPFSSLNPVWPVGKSIEEPLKNAGHLTVSERRARVSETMKIVGLDPAMSDRRPKSFSGGQRQRIAIARAIISEPKVLVCDEAVSSLDVSTKNQILRLLRELRDRLSIAVVFISHDIAVVRQIADTVAVMYLGRIVEVGSSDQVLGRPRHPYSVLLRDSVPRVGWTPSALSQDRAVATGDPSNRPSGCVYGPRCAHMVEGLCDEQQPVFERAGSATHLVACIRHRDIAGTFVEVTQPNRNP